MAESPVAESAEHLLRLLSLLTVRRCWRADDLAERLCVTPRTVRRDVGRLRGLGYQVRAVPGPGGGYELGAGSALPPMLLDDEAAVAVAVGLRIAAGGAVAGTAEAAVRAMAVIERVLPDRLRRRATALQSAVLPLPSGTLPADPDLLGLLALACRDSERLRFSYANGDGRTGNRHAVPFRLVSTGRRWYLVARARRTPPVLSPRGCPRAATRPRPGCCCTRLLMWSPNRCRPRSRSSRRPAGMSACW
jgi:predicted DNA-binding transcriptional regulator YafY